MKTITAKANQTVYDIALEQYGTIEALGEIMTNNPGLRNDPAAVIALELAPGPDGFYLTVPLLPGSSVAIDTDSILIRRNTVRELTEDITTFDL